MDKASILGPMGALAALTFIILAFIPLRRVRAVIANRAKAEDFKFGESAAVPGDVSIPNRNYMNLLEQPVLFYVLCLAMFEADRVTALQLVLAWSYVGLRALHSVIHLTFNTIAARLTVFALSNLVLMGMWAVFFLPGKLAV